MEKVALRLFTDTFFSVSSPAPHSTPAAITPGPGESQGGDAQSQIESLEDSEKLRGPQQSDRLTSELGVMHLPETLKNNKPQVNRSVLFNP